MSKFKVGIIGCGRPWRTEHATGFGQGHVHAAGYKASADCQIVAAADIKAENLEAFCQTHNVPQRYLDYQDMLAKEALDIVSVTVWPHLHFPISVAAAQAGVKAIHCEKPIALNWGEARQLINICREHNVQLTFNHQRRFGQPFRRAKALLDSGTIGQLTRMEAFCPDLFDWGTHWFDMMFMYNDETPAEWVIGQIDIRGHRNVFGVIHEGQGLSHIQWSNGVQGLLIAGGQTMAKARETVAANRLIGSEGVIEVGVREGPQLRYHNLASGGRWQEVAMTDTIHGQQHHIDAILDVVEALKNRREPELSGQRALRAAELSFASYESSRRRGRVDLPLDIEDSPLPAMLDAGDLRLDG
jgi:predicted dehydrogenase